MAGAEEAVFPNRAAQAGAAVACSRVSVPRISEAAGEAAAHSGRHTNRRNRRPNNRAGAGAAANDVALKLHCILFRSD